MAKLDSWFFFGGKRIKIIRLDGPNMAQGIEEEVAIPTCIKILKVILALILIPFVLLAWVIRYQLHANFKCNVEASPRLPVSRIYKCNEAKIEEMINLLDLETLEWPSRCLREDMVFANRLEETLIQEMRESETGELISFDGKRKLVRLLLMYFFNPPKTSCIQSAGRHGVVFSVFERTKREEEMVGDGPNIRSKEEMWILLDRGPALGVYKTIWFSVFFEVSKTGKDILKESIGGEIFKRLNAIFKTSIGQTLYLVPELATLCFCLYFSGCLHWEDNPST
ncbi:DUF648 domain-containing protein [Candidatus Chlamydia corallus]|uniref:DUF648 domain-containing protein n=1 Tax=Candidatus Chlamydia corallus TaxID=2038470 RepID=UPI001EFCE325|nr:DUF648 domain-containing protein [Candidatus Chlamydia corallus]